MSKIEVNTVEPQCGTTLTVGKCTTSVAVPGNVVKSNALQASDGGNIVSQSGTDITLGASGDTINLASGASQSGFGRTGTVDWQTGSIKTATFTAATGEGYFCNTTSGTFEVDLPAGAAGSIVSIQDYNNTFDSNSLTVDPDGSEKINGGEAGATVTLTTEGLGITFVYIDSTVGWRSVQSNEYSTAGVTPTFIAATGGTPCAGATCGDYKIHTFTGPGTLCVSAAGNEAGSNGIEYLVVAGGGGSGGKFNTSSAGSGGGAGGFRFGSLSLAPVSYPASPLAAPTNLAVSVQAYPIAIGGGGSGGALCRPGTAGSVASFSTIPSAGGGGGSGGGQYPGGDAGGSGGGTSCGNSCTPTGTALEGNTPDVSPPQGNPGGAAQPPGNHASGGGGALAAGTLVSAPTGGPGGVGGGLPTAFGSNGEPCGSYRYYAGGGAGGGYNTGPNGVGGVGGGGDANITATPGIGGSNGTVNTGGGAGGVGGQPPATSSSTGSGGGSGIVVIRYKFQ